MKKLLLLLLLLFSITSILFGQKNPNVLDGYKFAYVKDMVYQNGDIDIYGLQSKTKGFLYDLGLIILPNDYHQSYREASLEYCKVIEVLINHTGSSKVIIYFQNCENKIVYKNESTSVNWNNNYYDNYNRSLNNIFKEFGTYKHKYDKSKTPIQSLPKLEVTNETEVTLTDYFTNNMLDEIEGIYKSYQSDQISHYKFGIKKYNNIYKAIIIESDIDWWKVGEVKAVFEKSAMKGLFSTKWFMGNKQEFETFGHMENPALLSIEFIDAKTGDKRTDKFIKLFPTTDVKDVFQDGDLKSTGSGFVISEDGLVATNAHVIDNADRIEVTFNSDIGLMTFSAEVLLKDVSNDVALLRIDDKEFKGFNSIPYSILEDTEIGEKVFTIGYPLSGIMGDNFKVTNGIISSNTGLKDDVRFMQITTPVQPGNSGGPLFNKDGNVVGLTTAKLNERAVGTSIENVNYAIKSVYLLNILNMLPDHEKIINNSELAGKALKDQIKVIKNYVCLIKVF